MTLHFVRHGGFRNVLITQWFVVKFPKIIARAPWPSRTGMFLNGLLQNQYEARVWKDCGHYLGHKIAKVFFVGPLGLFLVMESCPPRRFSEFPRKWRTPSRRRRAWHPFDVDDKPLNFGYSRRARRIVLVDYAT